MNNKGGRLHFSITADNNDLKRKLAEARQGIINSGKTAEEQGLKIEGMFKRAAGAVAAFGGTIALGATVKSLYDFSNAFDKSMKEVSTISDVVSKNINGFKRQIMELGTKVPIAADAAGKALYQIVSAGYDGAAGMNLLEVSAKSAIAGMTDTTTAADAITTLLNAYKKSASEASSISDQLFMTAKLGKTTFGELGQSISQAAPIAASFGIETEQVLAAVATLTKSGTPTAQAMTQIRASIIAATKVLGDGYFATHTFQEGLQEIANRAGGSESKLRALVPEIEAMNGVLGLTGINAKMAASDLEALGGATGETEKAFMKMNDSADNQLTILKNNMLNKFQTAGNGMRDIVGEMAKFLNNSFDSGAINDVIASVGVLIATLGVYKTQLIVVNALKQAHQGLLYTAHIEELQKLITVKEIDKNADLQKLVANKKLSADQASKIAQLQEEANAKLQEMQIDAAKAAAEVRNAKISIQNTGASISASRQKINALRLEQSAAIVGGNAIKANALQEGIYAERKELSALKTSLKTQQTALGTLQDNAGAKAIAANTFQQNINNVSTNAGTKATGFLSVAKIKLTAITAKLNDVITKNPYAIAAVAIAALAYGIYKLCTAQSAAERAQEAFNEKIEEGKKKQDEFVSKTNELIGVIRTETNTRYMQTKAFKELNDKYPELLKNMSMEKLLLMDNIELQKFLAQYTEGQDKKGLFAGLDEATRRLDRAKKSLSEFQNRAQTSWELMNGGKKGEDDYVKRVQYAEEYLKQWQDKLKKHRQIEADARPVDVKTADLSQNITLLENQLAEVQRLQDEAKKNNPFGWNLYELQIGAINAQISAKKGELKVLNNDTAQTGQDKNKAYWEAQKKNAQEALEAMGEAKKNTKECNAEIAKINQASSKLKQWDVSGKGDAKDANTLKKLAQEITSNQLKLEDEKTAILEDGRTKRLSLSEQELAEKKAILKKEYDETVAEYKKLGKVLPKEVTTTYNQRIEVANTAKTDRDTEINKDADKELQEHQKSITDVFLNEESKRLAAIKERYDKEREWADVQFKGGNTTAEQRDNYKSGVDKSQQYEELESLLKEYQTYADKRKEIEEKFNSEIATLQSKNEGGKYDANIKQAEKQKKEALSKTDFEEQKKGIDFTQLFGNLDNLTLPSMKSLRDKIKAWIDEAGNSLSPEDLKAVSDAFQKLELKLADKDPFTILISSVKELKTASKEAEDAQKALNAAIAKSGKDSDVAKNAAEAYNTALEKRAAAATKANEAIGSVADKGKQIVGAAIDVMNIMGDLGIKVPEEIAGVIDGIGQMMDGLASIDLTKPLSIVTGSIKMIGGLVKSITSVFNGDKKKEKEIKRLQEQVDALGASYKRLGKAIDKAYSADAAALIKEQDAFLRKKKALTEEQIRLEESKKKPDHERVNQLKQVIEEIDDELEQTNSRLIEAFVGTDVKSAISEFADAYVDAWAAGEDKAAAMKDVVRKMVKSAVIELVKSRLSPEVTQFMEFLAKAMEDGILTSAEEAALDEFERRIYTKAESIDQNFGKYIKDEDADKREASQKGFTSMSQDSANELNGSFAAMHGILFDVKVALFQMLELQKQNLPQLQHLTHLSAISENTAYCRRLEGIEKDMSSMKNDINTIVSRGIKIKK